MSLHNHNPEPFDPAARSGLVLAARPESDTFWRLDSELEGFPITRVVVPDGASLLQALRRVDPPPGVVLFSTKLSERPADLVRALKRLVSAEVIAVTPPEATNHECAIRAAGVFYYLILPSELETTRVAVECADRLFRSKLSPAAPDLVTSRGRPRRRRGPRNACNGPT